MTLDELPSLVFVEDQALLTQMVTGCLIDGRPLDGSSGSCAATERSAQCT